MFIRKATTDDLHNISFIDAQIQPHPWSREAYLAELSHPDAINYVADPGNGLAGYCLARKQGDSVELMIIGVAPNYQRQGLARRLINTLKSDLPSGTSLFLEVAAQNVPAVELYLKLGFQSYLTRKQYYRDGTDALCMKLQVAKT